MKRGKITSRRVRQMNFKASKLTAAPYILWVLIFIIVPLALIAVFAFTTTVKVDSEGNILSAEEISVMEEELAVYNEENGTD